MTIGARDAGGAAKTASEIRVRDASNTSKAAAEIRVRDASNTSRQAYLAAGGGGGGPAISPADSNTASRTSKGHTTSFTVGGTSGSPTYAWGTDGAILSGGQGTATASFTLYDNTGDGAFASIWCDVTVSGVTTRLYATMEHTWTGSGFVSPGGPLV